MNLYRFKVKFLAVENDYSFTTKLGVEAPDEEAARGILRGKLLTVIRTGEGIVDESGEIIIPKNFGSVKIF